jgi:NADP-dependent 3-hydroxy acid dehydrogenase YdfG
MSDGQGSLAGRVALVTGASSGIGLAAARLFADEGAVVHAAARRTSAIEDGVGPERLASGRITAHELDVADPVATDRVASEIGRLDLLVCAAGTNVPERRLGQLTRETWDQTVDTNLTGAFHSVRACLPALRESRGQVILIASVSGAWPDVSGPAYQASKGGMIAFGRAAGLDEQENGVRFTSILPGIVDTPILDRRPAPPDPRIRAHALQPEDVAQACLYVATLPLRVSVPELTILPAALQTLGRTGVASPDPSPVYEERR